MKKFFPLTLLAAALWLCGCATTSQSQNNPWEYKSVTIYAVSPADFNQQLQAYGLQGWSVVYLNDYNRNLNDYNQNGTHSYRTSSSYRASVVLRRPRHQEPLATPASIQP